MEESNQENLQSKLPKLKAFKTIQSKFSIIGICPKLATQSYPLNGKISIGFLLLSSALIFVSVFTVNDAETFSEYTQSIYIVSLATLLIFALMIIIFNVEKLFEFINCCDIILNTTLKYSATRSISYKANQFEEKWSEILYLIIAEMTPVCVYVPWAIYIYFLYFTTDLGADAFELPFPLWFPFDWKNPFGFFIAIAIEYVLLSYGVTIGACVFALGIGSYLYGTAMSKGIKGSLFAINRNTRDKTDRSILLEQFIEFLELHSRGKQLVSNFSDIFQQFIMILFMWCLVTICGALLMIQIQLVNHSDNSMELLITMIEAFYAFGALFIACELGQRINLAFNECSEIVNQFEWYLFPNGIQRWLPLILNFTQQSFELKCFGSAACDRETFKVVIKTAFSYFTVLREFNN